MEAQRFIVEGALGSFDQLSDLLEVADEFSELSFAILRPQDRGRMHGCDRLRRQRRVDEVAALARDAEVAAEQRLGRGRAETDEHARLQHRDLGIQPRPAGGDLAPVRLLMDSALALGLPLEVLDDIGDVDLRAVDLDLLERPVEQLSRGPDERTPFEVLAVAGLLADEDDVRVRGSLAENGLRAGLPERSGLASRGRLAQLLQARPLGNERRGGAVTVD